MIDDGVFYLTNLCGVQDKCIFFLFCVSVRHTGFRCAMYPTKSMWGT